jgi:hypothetical protein
VQRFHDNFLNGILAKYPIHKESCKKLVSHHLKSSDAWREEGMDQRKWRLRCLNGAGKAALGQKVRVVEHLLKIDCSSQPVENRLVLVAGPADVLALLMQGNYRET